MKRDDWENPIQVIQKQMQLQQEKQIMKAIQDRDQYSKGYEQGREDAIAECIDTLYEVTPQTIDEKLDMVFVNALKQLKEKK